MSKERDITSICARLTELEAERNELNKQLVEAQRGQEKVGSRGDSPTTVNSTAAEKIALFRRLFAGRPDVFPVRWENRNTGKSGYAPAWLGHANIATTRIYDRRKMKPEDSPTFKVSY